MNLVSFEGMTSIHLGAGTYIVAVSGGVDSVVLLSQLVEQTEGRNDIRLVVAHVDHGIRSDSAADAVFVQNLAASYGLPFEMTALHLGVGASEALARDKRYVFLRSIQRRYGARAVITAHHQDDVIETSMMNLLRGTGRLGLTSLRNRADIVRPLLGEPKRQLVEHAKSRGLSWREDSTNADQTYARNKIRHRVVATMTDEERQRWLEHLNKAEQLNQKIDTELSHILRRGLHKGQPVLNRAWFRQLPHAIAREVVVGLLRNTGAQDIDRHTVERLVVGIKVLPHGKLMQAVGVRVRLTKRSAHFEVVAKSSTSLVVG